MSWFQARKTSATILCASVLLATTLTLQVRAFADDDRDDDGNVVMTFSTVGDSRQDPNPSKVDPTVTPTQQDKIWLQNTKAWSRILRTIQAQKSNFLFFNGDMVMGYGAAVAPTDTTKTGILNSDLMAFYKQYAFWRGMVANAMETGTYVVPVPGNHETQCNSSNTKLCATSGKHAMAQNEDAWRDNMGDLILDDARFETIFKQKPTYEDTNYDGSKDNLSNQAKLYYSFDLKGSHFVVLNTDPFGSDGKAHDATVAVNWLAQDLADASGRGVQHYFIFGHKPAYTYYYGVNESLPTSPSGLDATLDANKVASNRDKFWDLVEQYNATYFCGHEHIFHLAQPRGRAWQVLVGSGGSPFEALPTDTTINPETDRDYAWATVKVYENGKVKITAYGFNDQLGPTHVIGQIKLK